MPPRPLRPCRGPGCPATSRDPSGYCDACRPAAEAKAAKEEQERDKRRGTAAERGYGSEWAKIRRATMRRHGGLCVDCKAVGLFVKAVEVHHVDENPRNNAPENLAPLCEEHHDKRHGGRRRGGFRAGR